MVREALYRLGKSLLKGSEKNPQFSVEITIDGQGSFKADFTVRTNNSVKLRMVTLVFNPKVYIRGCELSATCRSSEFRRVANEVIIRERGRFKVREWEIHGLEVEFFVDIKLDGKRYDNAKAVLSLRESSTHAAQLAQLA